MDIKKILVLIVAMALMCTPAFAGEQPEYDNVGCDANAFFNDYVKLLVCLNNNYVNLRSDFTDDADPKDTPKMKEYFTGPGIPGAAGDPCFSYYYRILADNEVNNCKNDKKSNWKHIKANKIPMEL